MSDQSKIEWTDATWNPVTGCSKISPGCKNCYAQVFAERWRGISGHPFEQGFDLRLWPGRLSLPLLWKRSRRIFVNSMSDLFHKDIPDSFIDKVFDTMTMASHHIFQVLTKRSERMMKWATERYQKTKLPGHIWLGVSVESNEYTWRIEHLQETPANLRFLSIEPLLGPIHFQRHNLEGIDWVIVGGESGHKARRMQSDWAKSILSYCKKHNIAFFFKQRGTFDADGKRVGKKLAGRLLEGRTWNDIPNTHINPRKNKENKLNWKQ